MRFFYTNRIDGQRRRAGKTESLSGDPVLIQLARAGDPVLMQLARAVDARI